MNVRWSFPAQPDTPGLARQNLDRALDTWGVPPDDRWPALMVVSELVTNAVEHARTPVLLNITMTDGGLLVEVQDESADEPRLRLSDDLSPRGHGLRVVQGLADRWSWMPAPGGKTVWATVPLSENGDG